MAQQIKNFWLKLLTTLFTIYFVPFSNCIKFLFSKSVVGEAYAGTITCKHGSVSVDTSCDGVSTGTIIGVDQSVQCGCTANGKSGLRVVSCTFRTDNVGVAGCTNSEGCNDISLYFVSDVCDTSTCKDGTTKSCSENNGSGIQTCKNTSWGECVLTSCNTGYGLVNSLCKKEGDTCLLSNGTGVWTLEDTSESSSESSSV